MGLLMRSLAVLSLQAGPVLFETAFMGMLTCLIFHPYSHSKRASEGQGTAQGCPQGRAAPRHMLSAEPMTLATAIPPHPTEHSGAEFGRP